MEIKARPSLRGRFKGQVASHGVQHAPGKVQPQAKTIDGLGIPGLQALETLEQQPAFRLWDARALIPHLASHPVF
jgi:hypothetical protein